MTTTTSCSNLSEMKKTQFGFLYRHALKKTAGWTAIYSILCFLCFPLVSFRECMGFALRYTEDYLDRLSYLLNHQVVCSGLVSALMCGMVLVYSAVLYSYMHGKRSADFYHSMPVDRKVMLLANFSAGFTNLVIPLWISSILAAAAYPLCLPGINFLGIWKVLALQAIAWTMGAFILLAISTMVAVCVATAVENVGYTVALLLEGSILLLIWDLACSSAFSTYISIFDGRGVNNILTESIYYLSPVFALARVILELVNGTAYLFRDIVPGVNADHDFISYSNWLPLILWLLLGVGALWLALKLYDKRQSELAQQWGRQSWLGFTVKLMSAIIGTWLFANTVGDMLGIEQRFAYTFGALIGAPLVYLVIEAITNKGFTNMKKCLPYLGAAVAITVVGSLYFVVEGFGYDKRIPEVEQVKTVELELTNFNSGAKWNDEYAMTYSEDMEKANISPYSAAQHGYNYEEQKIVLLESDSVEKVTKIHRDSLDSKGDYYSNIYIDYEQGLLDTRRSLNIRSESLDAVLELLHSEEYLNKHDPLFEMKGSHLKFVQIHDKVGQLLGDGEIKAEHYDALLEALRADKLAATAESLRDSKNNQEVVALQLVTKYPKEIYEETGDLYHYNTYQSVVVRKQDSNTVKLLEDLGYDLEVQEGFLENLEGFTISQAYRDGNLPGESGSGMVASIYEKYALDGKYGFDGNLFIRDKEELDLFIKESTVVYNGYGDQYFLNLYQNMGTEYHVFQFYMDRTAVAEWMVKRDNFAAPYILSEAEWEILQQDVQTDGSSEAAMLEESLHWQDYQDEATRQSLQDKGVIHLSESVSMLDYCKEHHPELLDGKTESERTCMAKTPLYNEEYGSFIRIYF